MSSSLTETSVRAALAERLAALRETDAFQNYLRVRDWVLDLKSLEGDRQTAVASAYWTEELGTLDYMFDASPLVIERLREHTFTVTGLRAYDYRTGKDAARTRFAYKLRKLREIGGDELLVPEPRLVGGFGYEIDGDLYNIDTLKYYEALIAMDRGGVLGGFRDTLERRLVWEIGPGWGGFPYTFKTLFPNTTYVIIDLPELFLFSATYLLTAFPAARSVFYRPDSWDPSGFGEADFVFIPNSALSDLRLPRLDLTVNTVSFQEMTQRQVEEYVSLAHELGSPYLYSLNRDRSLYNIELESVSEILSRWFWTHEIPILPVNYMKMLPEPKKAKVKLKAFAPPPGDLEYRHIVGKRRIVT